MNFQPIATRITLAAALLLTGFAHAQVSVQDAWVRATVPQQKATGAFMRLTAAQDMRLVAASSPVAGITEVHEMKMVDNVMKMRAVPALDLPAGQAVELKPGGYHIMLLDLKQPVAQGASVPSRARTASARPRSCRPPCAPWAPRRHPPWGMASTAGTDILILLWL